MNKVTMILAVGFLFVTGLALGRPDGGGGIGGGGGNSGGDRGGGSGGGWNGGGNADNGSTDNSDNYHNHSGVRGNVGGTTSAQPSYRSGGYGNYRYHNGWNRSYQGSHHFNRSNSYGSFNRNTGRSAVIPQNLRNMGITHVPHPLTARASLPNGFQRPAPGLPAQGPGGRPFTSAALSPGRMNSAVVRTQMSAIAGNHTFMARVAATTPTMSMRNQYYWHTFNGYNYANYYDRFGRSWFGWNFGAGFFWTQYYANNWWWYDPWWGRWCWWWDGGWWWQDPETTTVYVYNNGSYASTDSNAAGNANDQGYNSNDYGGPVYGDDGQKSTGGSSIEPNTSAENGDSPVDFLSQDGSVKVTVSAQGDAFLYRMNGSKVLGKPVFLGSNVQEVKFSNSGTKNEKILLILNDGSFSTFNADGTPADGARA